jgi:hypothetical protein
MELLLLLYLGINKNLIYTNNKIYYWIIVYRILKLIRITMGRMKISVAGKGRKLKPRTKEHCAALSKSLTGRKLSEDHVAQIKERPAWNKGLIGHYTQSEESNEKRSEALKGRVPWNKGKSPSKETLERQQLARVGKKRGPYKKKGA